MPSPSLLHLLPPGPQTGRINQQKSIFSQFWRLSPSFRCCANYCWHSLVVETPLQSLPSSSHWCSPDVFVSKFPLFIRTPVC